MLKDLKDLSASCNGVRAMTNGGDSFRSMLRHKDNEELGKSNYMF